MGYEDLRERIKARLKDAKQGDRFKPAEGENLVRILPTVKTKNHNGICEEFYIHRNVGPKKRVLTCGKDYASLSGGCWLCDVQLKKLLKSGNRSKFAQAEQMQPEKQCIFQIAIGDESGKLSGPKTWTLKPGREKSTWYNVMQILAKKDITKSDTGCCISFTRTGTGMNDTAYGAWTVEQPSKVPSSIITKMKTFDELIPAYSEAEQQSAYFGREVDEEVDDEDDEDSEDTETPDEGEEETKSEEESEDSEDEDETPKKKKKVVEDEGEDEAADEEDESEDSEDADEEEPPKKKKSKFDEDEDEDLGLDTEDDEESESEEDDSEEEEEPKPMPKGKSKPAKKAKKAK